MNIAKKISASANCRYGDPPVTLKKKVPSNAIAPTTAHTAVTTLEVRLANMREHSLSYGGLGGDLTEGLPTRAVRRFTEQRVSSCPYSPECVEGEFSEVRSLQTRRKTDHAH